MYTVCTFTCTCTLVSSPILIIAIFTMYVYLSVAYKAQDSTTSSLNSSTFKCVVSLIISLSPLSCCPFALVPICDHVHVHYMYVHVGLKYRAPISCLRCERLRNNGKFVCGRCGDMYWTKPIVPAPGEEADGHQHPGHGKKKKGISEPNWNIPSEQGSCLPASSHTVYTTSFHN